MRDSFLKFQKFASVCFLIICIFVFSGCALLLIPGAGLLGHTIQKSNEEYDNIIVNFGIKYKAYYSQMTEANKQREASGQQPDKILEFKDWLETQGNNEVEKKAIARYKRIS